MLSVEVGLILAWTSAGVVVLTLSVEFNLVHTWCPVSGDGRARTMVEDDSET